MKLIALVASLLGGFGIYVGGAQVYFQETQPASRAAPSLSTDGQDMGGLLSFHARYTCSDGSNITAGSAVWWARSTKTGTWAPGPTYANFTLATGGPEAVGPELTVSNPFGRHTYQSVGINCSGGSWDGGALLTIEANQQ